MLHRQPNSASGKLRSGGLAPDQRQVRAGLVVRGYPTSNFHIDIPEVRTEGGKPYLLVVIDRSSKFAMVQLVGKANRKTEWEFVEHLREAVPYRIHACCSQPHDSASLGRGYNLRHVAW